MTVINTSNPSNAAQGELRRGPGFVTHALQVDKPIFPTVRNHPVVDLNMRCVALPYFDNCACVSDKFPLTKKHNRDDDTQGYERQPQIHPCRVVITLVWAGPG